MSDKEIIELDIQPSTEVYGYFRSLSYTEGHALAEFIDNSTQSFYDHIDELKQKANQDSLKIIVNYDPNTDTITIEDNAFGMELENFKRAVLLGKNTTAGKRNEFGFGLKTAATWFGDVWTVESTEYGSNNLYKITMDIDSLVKYKTKVKPIEKTYIDRDTHYTIITISKLNKKLNTRAIKNEIVNILGSTYRRDLKSRLVNIIYNGITLEFVDYPVLKFRNREWKKPINFTFMHDNKNHHVTGFVAIMRPGGYEKTGFALFRNNRVVVSGKEFRPKEIFSQSQSQISLKLFGELNLEDFAVTQAKDNFAWTSELREEFIQNLKNNILEYIDVAKMSWTDMDNEEASNNKNENESDITEEVASKKENDNYDFGSKKDDVVNDSFSVTETYTENTIIIDEINKINYEGDIYSVNWIDSKTLYSFDNDAKTLDIGLENDIVKRNINNKKALSEFVLAFAYAENESKAFIDSNGKVPLTLYRNMFEKILKGIK